MSATTSRSRSYRGSGRPSARAARPCSAASAHALPDDARSVVGQRRHEARRQHLGSRHRSVGPRGCRSPGQRRQPARPEAQAHHPTPPAHRDVEAAGAHAGDRDGLAARHPGPRVAAELDGERARGVRQHLAVVPAPGREIPPQRPPVLHPALRRLARRLAHQGDVPGELVGPQQARRRGGRRRCRLCPIGHRPTLGRVDDNPGPTADGRRARPRARTSTSTPDLRSQPLTPIPDERHHHGDRRTEDAHPRQLRRSS